MIMVLPSVNTLLRLSGMLRAQGRKRLQHRKECDSSNNWSKSFDKKSENTSKFWISSRRIWTSASSAAKRRRKIMCAIPQFHPRHLRRIPAVILHHAAISTRCSVATVREHFRTGLTLPTIKVIEKILVSLISSLRFCGRQKRHAQAAAHLRLHFLLPQLVE